MIKTTSLGLSKKMKELGFPQETSFWWTKVHHDGIPTDNVAYLETDDPAEDMHLAYEIEEFNYWPTNWKNRIAAPTAEEVLEQLPENIESTDATDGDYGLLDLIIWKEKPYYHVNYTDEDAYPHLQQTGELAEAAGLMWVYLKEQGLLAEKRGKV